MTELLVALPVALPVAFAAIGLLAWRRPDVQRGIALVGLAALWLAAMALFVVVLRHGPLVLAFGGWSAPIGITFRADLLGATMTLVTGTIALGVAVYAAADIDAPVIRRNFWVLILLLVMGVCGAFLTADLFNLFVWFEVLLIASFVLLALGREPKQLAGTHVYLVLNLIGSTLFLITVGLVYGLVHTLDFAEINTRMTALAAVEPGLVMAIQALLLVAFGLKAAIFPAMFWLPASYHTPPPAVSALFAALLTKIGVYAMIRVTVTVLPPSEHVHAALGYVAIATMLVGVLGALAQASLRRILSFHIVSQIGYMVAGLAVTFGTPAQRRFAIAATLFYIVHHIFVKTNLFLIAGIVRRHHGTERLSSLGDTARAHPFLAVLFLISGLSLAGVPPLSGFWAKLGVIRAALDAGAIAIVVVAVVTSLLTLLSMLKIWFGAFAGDPPSPPAAGPAPRRAVLAMYGAATALALVTLAFSLAPDLLFTVALQVADELTVAVPAGGAR